MNDIDAPLVADFVALVLLAGAVVLTGALARPAGRATVSADAVRLSAIVAAGATAGSLYFSEIADFVPCEMCWYQRIAMYPIAVIGLVAAFRRDRAVLPYLTVAAGIGLMASTYHIGIQLFPERLSFCDVANPCSTRMVEGLGWMTIPQMAAVCFTAIIAITITGVRTTTKETQ